MSLGSKKDDKDTLPHTLGPDFRDPPPKEEIFAFTLGKACLIDDEGKSLEDGIFYKLSLWDQPRHNNGVKRYSRAEVSNLSARDIDGTQVKLLFPSSRGGGTSAAFDGNFREGQESQPRTHLLRKSAG